MTPLWMAGAALAADGDDRWWVGLPAADVVLQAPEGGLPEEDLETLLRSKDGAPLDPEAIRLDLATLFQVGEFSAVEADVEPWIVYDADGNPREGALLTYVLSPAPKVARVKIDGADAIDRRALADAVGIDPGEVFFPDVDGPAAEADLRGWLLRKGWLEPQVRVRTSEPEPGRLYVVVEVDPGRPNTLDRLTFAGDLEGVVPPQQLRRWAARAGLVVGEPVAPEAVSKAQDEIRERLGDVRGSWFRRGRGWIGARVTPAIVPGPFENPDGSRSEGVRITFAVEPGAQLELDVAGMGFGGRRKVETALGIDHRLRITSGWRDDAPVRLEAFLQDRGYHEALATLAVEHPDARTDRLVVRVDRGAFHKIGDVPDLRFVDFDFRWGDGGPTFARDQSREAKAVQAVFDQASPDVLRRNLYTSRAMAVGAEAARQYCVDQGQLSAEVEVGTPEIRVRRTLANGVRVLLGVPRRRRITPVVTLVPGPTTTLLSLEVTGTAPEVPLPFLEEARAQAVGHPFSPQDLELLARRIVEAHKALGYYEADSRVDSAIGAPLGRDATIVLEHGPKVLLRSVITRGAARTRNAFLMEQIDPTIGAPVTSEGLEALRTNLYDLGIFRTVSTDLLGDEEARDLLVTVDEQAPWILEGGAGLSTDQGVRLFGRATRSNLWGVAHRVELFGQLGLDYRSEDIRDWLPDVLNPEWRAAVSYTAPRFPLQNQEVVADIVLRERVQERTWRMDRTGGGVALATRFDRTKTEVRAGARLEDRQLNQVDTAALLAGEPWAIMLGDAPALPSEWRWQESLTALVIEDLRDDPVLTRRGLLLSLNGELAPGLPWPNQPRASFWKGEARLSSFVPLGPVTLRLAASGGYVTSATDGLVPLEDRFRLGGTGSLRGFVRDGVGPMNNAPRVSVDWPNAIGPVIDYALRDDPDRWTPTGGDTLAQGTTELLVPLTSLGLTGWEGYSAELFWDFGNVWLTDPAAIATTESRPAMPTVRHGVGAGLQVATPIGPLQLDVAVNPQAAGATGARRVLLVRALEEPWWRAHLTLGATF